MRFNSSSLPIFTLSSNGQLAIQREKYENGIQNYLDVVDLLAPTIERRGLIPLGVSGFKSPPFITPKFLAVGVTSRRDFINRFNLTSGAFDYTSLFVYHAVPSRDSRRNIFSAQRRNVKALQTTDESDVLAIDDETKRIVLASENKLFLYQMELPAVHLQTEHTLSEGDFHRYGTHFANGILTLTSGTTIQQFTFGEHSINEIASFNLGDGEKPYALTNADSINDAFWVATSTSSIVKVSMKQKKVMQRVKLANGKISGQPFQMKMAGKFLVGKLSQTLKLPNGKTEYPYSLAAFDTENGDLEASFDGNVHSRVLLSSHAGGEKNLHFSMGSLASDGRAIMLSARYSEGDSFDFHVFSEEDIEEQYPRVNRSY